LGVKLTTRLHLMPRSKNDFLNTPSWRGAELQKVQGQLYLYLLPLPFRM